MGGQSGYDPQTHAIMAEAWDAQRTETFRAMWNNGATCSQIARTLGVSPSAVAGKRNRLKLPQRPNPSLRQKQQPPPPTWAAPAVEDITGRRWLLWEMSPDQCHWPTNDGNPFLFCGAPAKARHYCANHHSMAWKQQPQCRSRFR